MSVLVIVPTHLSVGGERGVSPGSPGQGTVVVIAWGVGAVRGDTRGKSCPGTMNCWCELIGLSPIAPDKDQDRFLRRWTIDRRPANSGPNRRSSPELGGILTSLHTER